MTHFSAFPRTIALLLCIALPVQQAAFATPARRQSSLASATLNSNIPLQIRTARTIFLANSGADPNFPIDPTRVYNDIYSALQTRGRYQLADSPAHADLIFQLRELAPITNVTGNRGGVYTITSPAFEITIIDPATSTPIWTITSPVTLAGRKQVFAHWVALSEANLVSRVEVLAGQPLTPQETADLTTVPRTHRGRTALIGTAAFVGLAVVGGLVLHHLYENGLADAKRSRMLSAKPTTSPFQSARAVDGANPGAPCLAFETWVCPGKKF